MTTNAIGVPSCWWFTEEWTLLDLLGSSPSRVLASWMFGYFTNQTLHLFMKLHMWIIKREAYYFLRYPLESSIISQTKQRFANLI